MVCEDENKCPRSPHYMHLRASHGIPSHTGPTNGGPGSVAETRILERQRPQVPSLVVKKWGVHSKNAISVSPSTSLRLTFINSCLVSHHNIQICPLPRHFNQSTLSGSASRFIHTVRQQRGYTRDPRPFHVKYRRVFKPNSDMAVGSFIDNHR